MNKYNVADPFEQPTPENIRRYAKLMVERINDDSWIRSYSERLLGIANNLEAQQTDTLSELRTKIEADAKEVNKRRDWLKQNARKTDNEDGQLSALYRTIELIDSAEARKNIIKPTKRLKSISRG